MRIHFHKESLATTNVSFLQNIQKGKTKDKNLSERNFSYFQTVENNSRAKNFYILLKFYLFSSAACRFN